MAAITPFVADQDYVTNTSVLKHFIFKSPYVAAGTFLGIMLADWQQGGLQRVVSALPVTIATFAIMGSLAWYLRRRERRFR